MNEDLHPIDDLFRKGLEGSEELPGSHVWTNIERELDRKQDRKPAMFFLRNRRAIAVALALVGGIIIFAGGYFLRARQDQKQTKSATSVLHNRGPVPSEHDLGKRSPTVPPAAEFTDTEHLTRDSDEKSGRSPQGGVKNDFSGKASATEVASHQRVTRAGTWLTARQKKNPGSIEPPSSKQKNNHPETSNSRPGSATNLANLISPAEHANHIKNQGVEIPTLSVSDSADMTETIADKQHAWAAAPERSRTVPLPATLSAPSTTIPVVKKRSMVVLPRFSLTPIVAWQTGNNRIKPGAQGAKLADEIYQTESQSMKLAVGLLANWRIAPRMTLQSGLLYTQRTIRIQPKYITAERSPDGKMRYRFECSAGVYMLKPKSGNYPSPGDSAKTVLSTNELNYLNIPLNLTYHVGGPKLQFFALAGTSLNLLTEQYLETGLKYGMYDENDTRTTNLRSNYWNANLGLGIRWQPSRIIGFHFSPQYQFGLSPINENMGVRAVPRIFSVQTGATISIR